MIRGHMAAEARAGDTAPIVKMHPKLNGGTHGFSVFPYFSTQDTST